MEKFLHRKSMNYKTSNASLLGMFVVLKIFIHQKDKKKILKKYLFKELN